MNIFGTDYFPPESKCSQYRKEHQILGMNYYVRWEGLHSFHMPPNESIWYSGGRERDSEDSASAQTLFEVPSKDSYASNAGDEIKSLETKEPSIIDKLW